MIRAGRRAAAMLAGKALTRAIRRTGRGGGTALPGSVALAIDPTLLDTLAARLPFGTVVVAGTNGKTTTTRMLASMAEAAGLRVVHNRAGSNLVRGITATFADQLPIRGVGADLGIIEADENAFPEIVRRTRPRAILLLNLFRDQLDRYGELEAISALWRPVATDPDDGWSLIVNADDPSLAWLADASTGPVTRFGLTSTGSQLAELPHAADAGTCRRCGSPLSYHAIYVSHLGDYHCPSCGLKRPKLDASVSSISPCGFDGQHLCISAPGFSNLNVWVPLPGLYNAYNTLAAVTTASVLGIPESAITRALENFEPAFGRLERASVDGFDVTLALAKNPTGFNELIRTLSISGVSPTAVLIGLNDLDADGRDVSWIWDVDFEALGEIEGSPRFFVAGTRGLDLAVRLKYAGIEQERIDARMAGRPYAEVLDLLRRELHSGEFLVALLTYTSMLQFREQLVANGALEAFWQQ